ncbi:ATP-binding protein [Heliorestis convoluta]|uniref:DNA replication protein n=1 Tax=Heliorestis convoluta TaxID=356322 RepID=A0A5Q2MXW1_9FIRM|nr:ATP-binding protein [Heliorestis convoluta]QGG47664.1 DNA replication protein [Heliorestis convoluta]
MSLEATCLLALRCKKRGHRDHCHSLCYPYLRLHGEKGTGGVRGLAQIPKSYEQVMAHNLPYEKDNPEAHAIVTAYCQEVLEKVDEGLGLYLYSIPGRGNVKGTGTGKTTTAIAILHEYLVARTIQHIKKERVLDALPALFINASRFQNHYNAQFRGPKELQDKASLRYYESKAFMLQTNLLVLDDIGIREATEAFKSEFYEVIDERAVDQKATVFTSNEPLERLETLLDPRIVSRIEGCTFSISFEGEDKRKKGALLC